jgi:hypothetical protein
MENFKMKRFILMAQGISANDIIAIFIILILSFFTFACGSTKTAIKPPQFRIVETTLAKGIYDKGTYAVPQNPTTLFSTDDTEIISYIKLKNLSGEHYIRWDWYKPDGTLYSSTNNYPIGTKKGKYRKESTVWHTILIKGDKAENYPGNWRVDVLFDNELLASSKFALVAKKEKDVPVTIASRKKSFAVVIGISKYLHTGQGGLTDLVFADDDAKAFHGVLLKMGWSNSHIKTLINEKATRNNILIALESWLTKAGKDDLIVLYWSGHGFPDPEDPEKVYFACYDTNIRIPPTGYRMDRINSIIKERNAKNVVILADTCHAGKLVTRGAKGISIVPSIEKMRREQNIPKGWIYMVGAESDRKAIEHTSWSNGAFTHCLLKGLLGEADGFESVGPKDGIVTMGELRSYMNSAMPDETEKILGVAKRPLITTSSGDPDIWNLSLKIK